MSADEVSPLPWHFDGGPTQTTVYAADGKPIIYAYFWPGDAAFIVRACNAHDAMLAALKNVEASLTALGAKGEPLKSVRAAIAKAEAQP
jgi:hypothetical protein